MTSKKKPLGIPEMLMAVKLLKEMSIKPDKDGFIHFQVNKDGSWTPINK